MRSARSRARGRRRAVAFDGRQDPRAGHRRDLVVDLRVVASIDQHLPRVGIASGASIYPLAWNILLAARNEGLGGVLTTMPIAEEARVKALLHLPDYMAVCAVIPIGKPLKQLRKLKRRPVSAFAHRERWDGEAFGG